MDVEVEVLFMIGTIPSRDLTDLLGLYMSGLGPDLWPSRSLIPPLLLAGELAGVLVAKVAPGPLGGCLRGAGPSRGYKVGRVSSRFLLPSLKSWSSHSSIRAIRRWGGCV